MGHISRTCFFIISIFLGSFLFGSTSSASSMSAGDIQKEVIKLFDQFELIPQVRISPAEEDRFVIELIFSIGDRWGRDLFVRDLAKTAVTKVFRSNLPIAQGVVRVYCTHAEVIHLAIGINQAKRFSWEDSTSPAQFFDTLQSCIQLGKRPEDRTYFMEHRQIIKPSPVVSFPPDSQSPFRPTDF